MIRQKTYSVDEALSAIRNFCSFQERCHKDVREKLQKMRMIPDVIDHIIAKLIEDNYLNEERYAKSFARGKFRIKSWGKNRIIRELKSREISKYNIDTALKEISENDYTATLHNLATKRLAQLKEPNYYKRKKKLCDYLLYRGWEPSLVFEKANELLK